MNIKKLGKLSKCSSEIQRKIDSLIETETGFSRDLIEEEAPLTYDIVVITATAEEFESIENCLNNFEEIELDEHDSIIYFHGEIDSKKGILKVLLPFPQSKGMSAASNLTTKLLKYQPEFVFMVGIAAGNKNVSQIGDILIADKSINYNEVVEVEKKDSEEIKKKFMQTANSIDPNLKSKMTIMQKKMDYKSLKNSFHDAYKIGNVPKILIGTIVTGSSLVRSQKKIKEINDSYHGVIGLDMETYGVYYCCSHSSKNKPPNFVSIKSVSDFGDNKNHKMNSTERKEYALYSSAFVFQYYLMNHL